MKSWRPNLYDMLQRIIGDSSRVNTTTVIESSDEQIGAVELKDGSSDNRASVDTEGNVQVLSYHKVEDFTFHNAATGVANGSMLEVLKAQLLRIQVKGTSTIFQLDFKALMEEGGTPVDLIGYKAGTFETGVGTDVIGESWEFEVAGYHKVYIDLSSISNGNVSVIGKVVS